MHLLEANLKLTLVMMVRYVDLFFNLVAMLTFSWAA